MLLRNRLIPLHPGQMEHYGFFFVKQAIITKAPPVKYLRVMLSITADELEFLSQNFKRIFPVKPSEGLRKFSRSACLPFKSTYVVQARNW